MLTLQLTLGSYLEHLNPARGGSGDKVGEAGQNWLSDGRLVRTHSRTFRTNLILNGISCYTLGYHHDCERT